MRRVFPPVSSVNSQGSINNGEDVVYAKLDAMTPNPSLQILRWNG